ncbi:conserved hypothetical protein [Leishmania mexicana MHOM/GT/2001/U1103]|uniref:Uncharacterized protein n=1 Tax=Leishmania mexicana (strain MHOM/GT/2001/U1103) TaxID=929439 RepID=E9B4V6_LEIMU|nr:conserved hypothetical protein [Leishmania mexicana MHOM/GT/2001/U1103]CBZ30275.1 conserved hypothetical protein [Leishmania mexicana MHOM/GT/2001/U1103]
MRSLICHRAAVDFGVGVGVGVSPIAQSRPISSFHRLARAHALGWGSSSISRGFPIEQGGRRGYGTTAVLLKQHQPTNTGASAASSRASGQASRKQPRQKAAANYGAAEAVVEPELDTVTAAASLPLAASSSEVVVGAETGSASSVPRHVSGQSATGRPKAVKRGRRKQEAAATSATRCASTPSANSDSSPSTVSSRKGPDDATSTLPPLEPPKSLLVAGEDGIIVAASSSRGKKRGRRGSAGSFLSSDAASSAAGGLESTVTLAANAPHTAALTPSSLFGSPQPVYYTYNMMGTTPRTEEQRVAERCSITKLIMVSGSVSFLSTTLPRSEGPLKMYVKDLNRAQAPTHDSVRALGQDATHSQSNAATSTGKEGVGSDHAAAGTHTLPAISEKQFLELRQRLCAEQLATNTVFIHVREMEQLVPPLHLQLPTVTDADKSESVDAPAAPSGETTASVQREGKTRGRRGRRRGIARAANPLTAPASTSTPPTPPLPALSPVERILALQAWKKEAARRAEETQARYLVPAHYHAITRVRFHDPHQTDLTVAMGSGWCKSIASVLRAIVRSMPQDRRGADSGSSDSDSNASWLTAEGEEDDGDNTVPPFPMPDPSMYSSEVDTQAADDAPAPEQPSFLSSPYTVKPLLTVCASCVPRREAWIGTCAPGPSAASASGAESEWSPFSVRAVPTVPRYSTRITIMLEHDDMDPSDLVSLAEISTTRKSSSSSGAEMHPSRDRHHDTSVGGGVDTAGLQSPASNRKSLSSDGKGHPAPKKPLHLYCLVQDAGEY